MKYDWILDVLGDLRSFAQKNGLKALAEQLDDTALVAAAEIGQIESGRVGGILADAGTYGAVHRGLSAGEHS